MAPFRPTNLNKRLYPGNAGVIGPTRQATIGFTTTSCCSSTNTCGACTGPTLCLGCRFDFCACPCCNICCCCPCTVCTRTVPSGIWKTSEQYEARSRDAWGPDTCSSGAPTCLCCTNIGSTCATNINDYASFFICCGPSTNKWFVAPSCTEVQRNFFNRGDAITCANSLMGSCGWFVPGIGQLQNPGYSCRSYWDSYASAGYWSSNQYDGGGARGWWLDMGSGGSSYRPPTYFGYSSPGTCCVRAFRCTAS